MSHEPNVTRKGKIACLPLALRTELNRRLDDGWRGPQILEWLNAEEPVRTMLERRWSGQPIKPQNLSEWRRGGYVDWRRQRDGIEKLRELAEYARELGEAVSGNIAGACATLAGARIMEAVDTADIEDVLKMVGPIASLRRGDAARVKLEQGWRRLDLQQQSLDQRNERIELAGKYLPPATEALFLEWSKDKRIRDILDGDDSHEEKIERLDRALFWKLDEEVDECPVDAVRPRSPELGRGLGRRQISAAGLTTCGDAILLVPQARDFKGTRVKSTQIKADQTKAGLLDGGTEHPSRHLRGNP
ncbi:MAG: hypothetical protein LV481_17595 [Methylacidiphilales bacterium]|nr:hypothetical protein [Candidatus Methylacidiphilales bacterium]